MQAITYGPLPHFGPFGAIEPAALGDLAAYDPLALALLGQDPAETSVVGRTPESKDQKMKWREKERGEREERTTWEIKRARFIRSKWDFGYLGSRRVRV